jgi:hypothetical protein
MGCDLTRLGRLAAMMNRARVSNMQGHLQGVLCFSDTLFLRATSRGWVSELVSWEISARCSRTPPSVGPVEAATSRAESRQGIQWLGKRHHL